MLETKLNEYYVLTIGLVSLLSGNKSHLKEDNKIK
jgi:hypothetical protein